MNYHNMQDKTLVQQCHALLEDEHDKIACLANISALLNQHLDRINWVGFYLHQENQLVLGPFQGKVACVRINLDQGVCGHAATIKKTVIVDNVHEFEGHIACDSASLSEIVIPMIKDGVLLGVLDIDSPEINRFNQDDKIILEEIVSILINQIRW